MAENRRPTVSLVAIEGSDADPNFLGYVARLVEGTLAYVRDGGCVSVEVHHDQEETVVALRDANAGLMADLEEARMGLEAARARIVELETQVVTPPPPPARPSLPLQAIALSAVSVRDAAGKLLRVDQAGAAYQVQAVRNFAWNLGDNRAVAGDVNVWAERLLFPDLAIPWPLRLADPLGHGRRINQPWGANPADYARYNIPGHNGIDLFAQLGDPVRACTQGVVYNVEQADGNAYGVHVQVLHTVQQGDTWHLFTTTYAHFKSAAVKAGDVVLAGDLLGEADSTGNSTGVHLHLGLDWIGHGAAGYGQAVDPLPYMDWTT